MTVDPQLVREVFAEGAAIVVGVLTFVVVWFVCAVVHERLTRADEGGGL